jgi:hypothetical protein
MVPYCCFRSKKGLEIVWRHLGDFLQWQWDGHLAFEGTWRLAKDSIKEEKVYVDIYAITFPFSDNDRRYMRNSTKGERQMPIPPTRYMSNKM